ncbi:pigment epithelium-derived factor-like [Salvelinus alpinus]|uniref:pigment epithelium-derived factor-like n=1 Tax=Salvelinus alpinus TaxID=8036 RepID=UPI0039FD2486
MPKFDAKICPQRPAEPPSQDRWITQFSQIRGMEDFQPDGEALTHIVMMTQNHSPVKLGCTVNTQPDEVTANMTLVEESLTAEFVQDLSMTLQPVKVAHTLPS